MANRFPAGLISRVRSSSNRLAYLLEPAFGLFLAACFLLPSGPAYALVFYLAVLPPLFTRLAFERPSGAPYLLGASLAAWSGLTLAWGHDDGGRTLAFAAASASTFAAWAGLTIVLQANAARPRLRLLLIRLGAANALAGLMRLLVAPAYQPPADPLRLHGWGITYHPVLGACVLSVCCLTALDQLLIDFAATCGPPRRQTVRLLLTACSCLLLVAAVLLTRSRGPVAALWAAAILLLLLHRHRALALACLLLPPLAWRLGSFRAGLSGHPAIWVLAWSQIRDQPLFGHGLAANLPPSLGADRSFPHDLYLSLLFYSGAIGLVLFLAWSAVLARHLARHWSADLPWIAALCVNGLLAGLSDFGQITKGPGPLWLIIWLPAALAATASPLKPVRS